MWAVDVGCGMKKKRRRDVVDNRGCQLRKSEPTFSNDPGSLVGQPVTDHWCLEPSQARFWTVAIPWPGVAQKIGARISIPS